MTDKAKRTIKIDRQEFPGTLKNFYTTGKSLAEIVNQVFAGVFGEFCGSHITISELQKINWPVVNRVFLYFEYREDVPEGTIKNLYRLGVDKDTGKISRTAAGLNVLREKNKGKLFELNDETKEYLSEFVPRNNNGKPLAWDKIVFEQSQKLQNGGIEYYVVVELDLIAILKKIWGARGSETSKYDKNQYMVSLIKAMPSGPVFAQYNNPYGAPITNGYREPNDWILNVGQLNTDLLNRISTEIGYSMPQASAIPIVRAKRD